MIRRRSRPPMLITVVPMIDVLMILLIFFMVTSSYLNLNMVPAVQADDATEAASPPSADTTPVPTLLVRLGADGVAVIAGQRLDPDALQSTVSNRLRTAPETPVVVLPSGAADTQSLIALMDRIARAGAAQVRIIRIEPTAGSNP